MRSSRDVVDILPAVNDRDSCRSRGTLVGSRVTGSRWDKSGSDGASTSVSGLGQPGGDLATLGQDVPGPPQTAIPDLKDRACAAQMRGHMLRLNGGMEVELFVRSTVLAAILALGASGCSTAGTTPSVPASPTGQPGPAPATTPTPTAAVSPAPSNRTGAVTKVLVFVEENHSLAQMKAEMPYTFGLGQRFGYATHYTAITHPSLPNYIAVAGGQTYAITNDDSPGANPVAGTSVFGQAVASGKTAAVYADGMEANCATSDGGTDYAVKHNPWAYFTGERAACGRYDVPVDRLGAAIAGGTLPNVAMVIPNLCNDAHDCPLATADTWFKGWMTRVFAGPDWKSGHLAVVLTADEDDQSARNTVLTVVIHPSQKAHVVTTALTHYSLTRLYEEVAGTAYLFGAASAPSMATAFGLPLE